jgi:lysozyme
MKPSQKAVDFIKKEELLELKAYKDSAGVWTIGYGTIEYPDGKPVKDGHIVTMQRAEDLLKWQMDKKAIGVEGLLMNTVVNQNQFDALVSFTYNCGYAALRDSTLLKKVRNNPNDPTIRDEFLRWNKITKNGQKVPLEGLTKRRKREADLYFTPINNEQTT